MRNLILFIAILVSGFVSAQTFDFRCINHNPGAWFFSEDGTTEITDTVYLYSDESFNFRFQSGDADEDPLTYVSYIYEGGVLTSAANPVAIPLNPNSPNPNSILVTFQGSNGVGDYQVVYEVTDGVNTVSNTISLIVTERPPSFDFVGTLPGNWTISDGDTCTICWEFTYVWSGSEGNVLVEFKTPTITDWYEVSGPNGYDPAITNSWESYIPANPSSDGTWSIRLTDLVTEEVIEHSFEVEITQN